MMLIDWGTGVLVFIFGLMFGSFLNVCVYRLPRNLSIVSPGSFCPHCRKEIAWFDNIPLLSYLVLLGRCRHCRKKITPRYFLVELLTGLLLLLLYLHFGISAAFFAFSLFVLGLILVSFIDWEHYVISGPVVYPGMPLGLIFNFIFPEMMAPSASRLFALRESFVGLLAGAGVIFLIRWIASKLLKKEAMGEGDILLLGMIGAFLGWRLILITLFAASIIGSVVGITLIALGVKKRHDPIPFGPFLSLGAVIALFYGNTLLDYYMRLVYPDI